VPVYVPSLSDAALALTAMDAGVEVPCDGVAVSHAALEDAAQVTEVGDEVRLTVCAGAVAPGVALKLSEVGDAVTVVCATTAFETTMLLYRTTWLEGSRATRPDV